MKKSIALVLAVLMMVCIIPFTVSAGAGYVVENDPVATPKAEDITIDGVISATDGYSEPAKFNEETAGYFWHNYPLCGDADLYFAWTDDGLAFAYTLNEYGSVYHFDAQGEYVEYKGDGFVYSTGLDDIDGDYGFNGDIITLMLDPEEILINEAGLTGGSDYSAWYNFGVFEGEDGPEVHVFRSKLNEGDITESIVSAAKVDGNKVTVEAILPWDVIIQDVLDCSYNSVSLEVADLAKEGAMIKAAVMWMDRFYDAEQEANDTWGRFITVCEKNIDGVPGGASSGDDIKEYGITLNIVNELDKPLPFKDVAEGKWYYNGVKYCYNKGYMSGMNETTFGINSSLTRAQIVVILAAMSGDDLTVYADKTSFNDCPAKWYHNQVEWAVDKGVTGGAGAGKFNPNGKLTRQDLSVMLMKYAQYKGASTTDVADLTGYADYSSISNYAKTAMGWAVAKGLISGMTATTVGPRMTATRSQAATIIMNLDKNVITVK